MSVTCDLMHTHVLQ